MCYCCVVSSLMVKLSGKTRMNGVSMVLRNSIKGEQERGGFMLISLKEASAVFFPQLQSLQAVVLWSSGPHTLLEHPLRAFGADTLVGSSGLCLCFGHPAGFLQGFFSFQHPLSAGQHSLSSLLLGCDIPLIFQSSVEDSSAPGGDMHRTLLWAPGLGI